jgi:hypothetical protein
LEILPDLFGLFGFGWIYSGNATAGLIWLFGVLMWDVFAIIFLVVTAGGLGGCFWLHQELEKALISPVCSRRC